MRQTAFLLIQQPAASICMPGDSPPTLWGTNSHEEQGLLDRYEEYLESILDSTEEFHEIEDIILRHATLQATNTDLMEQQQRVTDLAEQSRCILSTAGLNKRVKWRHWTFICPGKLNTPFTTGDASDICVNTEPSYKGSAGQKL